MQLNDSNYSCAVQGNQECRHYPPEPAHPIPAGGQQLRFLPEVLPDHTLGAVRELNPDLTVLRRLHPGILPHLKAIFDRSLPLARLRLAGFKSSGCSLRSSRSFLPDRGRSGWLARTPFSRTSQKRWATADLNRGRFRSLRSPPAPCFKSARLHCSVLGARPRTEEVGHCGFEPQASTLSEWRST